MLRFISMNMQWVIYIYIYFFFFNSGNRKQNPQYPKQHIFWKDKRHCEQAEVPWEAAGRRTKEKFTKGLVCSHGEKAAGSMMLFCLFYSCFIMYTLSFWNFLLLISRKHAVTLNEWKRSFPITTLVIESLRTCLTVCLFVWMKMFFGMMISNRDVKLVWFKWVVRNMNPRIAEKCVITLLHCSCK